MRDQVMVLIGGAGVEGIQGVLAVSVVEPCNERYARRAAEKPGRSERQRGELVPGERKVRIRLPHVRQDRREVPLPTYLEPQAAAPLQERGLDPASGGGGGEHARVPAPG